MKLNQVAVQTNGLLGNVTAFGINAHLANDVRRFNLYVVFAKHLIDAVCQAFAVGIDDQRRAYFDLFQMTLDIQAIHF